jgi:hypothetical protein
MSLRLVISTLLIVVLLSGCFQVERVGPVVGADVTIERLVGNITRQDGLKTRSEQYYQTDLGTRRWQSFKPLIRLLHLGTVEINELLYDDNRMYLVTASGGYDMDSNGDNFIDRVATRERIDGQLHALMTGAQLKLGNSRVSLLTEAFYQSLSPDLDSMTSAEIRSALNEMARATVEDINKDDVVDYYDALRWSNIFNQEKYRGSAIFLERLAFGVWLDLDDDTLQLMSADLIERAAWQPANPKAPRADLLAACASVLLIRDLCSFSKMPLIGMEAPSPLVGDIMDRVLVSDPWMAERFEQVLYEMPDDILKLMRSVAGIVIGGDIRPSYFSGTTAMIYLDAESFWMTERERETISSEADYRSEFDDEMAFRDLWRYVKDDDWAYRERDDVDDNGNRQLEDVALWSAALLFHELAHASDRIPYKTFSSLSMSDSPYDLDAQTPSDRLINRYPLTSPELAGVADVLFRGSTASSVQARYSGADIGAFFEPDRATDLYAYSTSREDFAMLFEELMMAIHFGVQRDVGFASLPAGGEVDSCSDLLIGWGMRGRIGVSRVKTRATLVLKELLPERNYSAKIASLPGPLLMVNNRDWCENISLSNGGNSKVASGQQKYRNDAERNVSLRTPRGYR